MAYNDFEMLPARAFRARFGRLETLEGGKDSPAAPDYTPVAAASKESAEIGAQLGREQLAENRRQYDTNLAVAKPIIDQQAGLMSQQIKQGDDYYNYMKTTFRPMESQMVADAKAAGGKGEQDAAAGRALADVTQSFSSQKEIMARDLARSGVDPSSGRALAAMRTMGAQEALAKAGGMTSAREQAKTIGYAKRMDAIGIGRGLPGASQGAYGLALNSGNSAVNNQNGTSAQFMNGMNAGNGLIMQGQGMKLQGLGNVAGLQTNAYNAGVQANAQSAAGLGSLVGTGIGAFAALSSKKFKTGNEDIVDAEILDEVKKLPVEKWKYKDGFADGGEHIGPYAEDVNQSFGDKAAPGGNKIDLVSMNGISLSAIKALSSKTDKLERRVAGLVTKLADKRG